VEQTPVREAVGNGEPPKPTQSEPIDHPAKKQHHTERNKQPQCRTSEGVFAPRWHIHLPSVGARGVVHSKENPAIEVAGLPDGKEGAGGLGAFPRPGLQPPAPGLVPLLLRFSAVDAASAADTINPPPVSSTPAIGSRRLG